MSIPEDPVLIRQRISGFRPITTLPLCQRGGRRVARAMCSLLALIVVAPPVAGLAVTGLAFPEAAAAAGSAPSKAGAVAGVRARTAPHEKVHHRHHPHHIRHPRPRPAVALPPGWAVPQGFVVAGSPVEGSDGAPRLVTWDGLTASLEAGATAHPPAWASVLVDGMQAGRACAAGWVRHLDGTPGCAVPGGYEDIALAWDRSRLPAPPQWSAFWDVARQPGRRGLFLGARTTLEIALLADGVAPSDVYAQLSTAAGVDRAFRRLDILRPYIVWWRTGDEAARIMARSGALMMSAPVSEVTSVELGVRAGAAGSIFVASSDERLRRNLFWTIPITATDQDARQTLERLRLQAPHLHPPAVTNGTAPDAVLTIDDSFWLTNGAALETRFQHWFSEGAK